MIDSIIKISPSFCEKSPLPGSGNFSLQVPKLPFRNLIFPCEAPLRHLTYIPVSVPAANGSAIKAGHKRDKSAPRLGYEDYSIIKSILYLEYKKFSPKRDKKSPQVGNRREKSGKSVGKISSETILYLLFQYVKYY
jgi:hypothetical protein